MYSLFQTLGQRERSKKRSRDERGLVKKGKDALSLPDPARRTSPVANLISLEQANHCRVDLGTAVENRKRNISWSNVMDRF